jgi:hypothetical protein
MIMNSKKLTPAEFRALSHAEQVAYLNRQKKVNSLQRAGLPDYDDPKMVELREQARRIRKEMDDK